MSGDELAVTMTATPATTAREETTQLGRYRIQREIGAGGMGVVYAAFDPELERSVAIKVVLPGVSTDAKQRLLREARAMARLAHPNVVTVYEVGSADGRDYIAMELIDGENLVDWLATKPGAMAVLDAFIAAGQGLATAHEAAIVHRDFKPHNVLRSRRGRVMVTDFGLARETATIAPASRDTQPLSGLTLTGAVLGTPAYMAPEQWQGGEVTPATDQFAFSVALVEALAGARPFRGDSVEELRDAVMRGPDRVDLSRVPRRLRAVLRRGMATDPARRWPSMNALLAHLHRRSRIVWLALVALAAIAALIAAVLMRGPETIAAVATAPACDAPIVDAAKVWNADADRTVRAGLPAAADRLAATFARWTAVHANVCKEATPNRALRLACLDKVLLRIDAEKRARLLDPKMGMWGLEAQLFEPDVCMLEDPPRMPASYTEAAIAGLALRGEYEQDPRLLAQLKAAPASDVCAHAYLQWFDDSPSHLENAKSLAQLCGDEQAYAAASMNLVAGRLTAFLDPALPRELEEVERIVDHAAQPYLTRQFMAFRGDVAAAEGELASALAFYRRAQGNGPAIFEISRRLKVVSILLERAELAAVEREVTAMRELWTPELGETARLEVLLLTAKWLGGDVRGTHAALVDAYQAHHPAVTIGSPVHGAVVDAHGAPVAGAMVVVGKDLAGDAVGPAVELYQLPDGAIRDSADPMQFATTDAHGGFAFAHVPPGAEVIAARGDERSLARPAGGNPRLALAPTHAVRGVLSGARGSGVVWVEASVPGQEAKLVAPVLADGSYQLGGLPDGKVSARLMRAIGTQIVRGPLSPPDAIAQPTSRALDVIVRGMAIDGGMVWVLAGSVRAETYGQLAPRTEPSEREVARAILETPMPELARRGDGIAHLHDAPSGPVTACAMGIHLDPSDPTFSARLDAQLAKQPVRCVQLDAAATRVVIEVAPMARVE